MTMYIELLAGPLDGQLVVVPDDTQIWVTQQPAMTPAQMMSMNEVLPGIDQVDTVPLLELAYQKTDSRNLTNGAILFRFAGVRQRQ